MLLYPIGTVFALTAIMPCEVLSKPRFALLPEGLDLKDAMRNPTDVGSAASSPQECVDLVDAAEPTAIAISFDLATNACVYSTSIYGYDRRDTEERAYYLRVDTLMKKQSESECFTTKDAEYVIVMLSFGDEQCVESNYDASIELCVFATNPPFKLGRYHAGRLADGTRYALSRDKAIKAIDYECPNDASEPIPYDKMTFGGTWYCYNPLNVSSETDKPALIKNNKCGASLGSGSAPIKITETREYGYVYDIWTFQQYTGHIYLGLYATGNRTSGDLVFYDYAWYDGSSATDLPWKPGRPSGQDMVWARAECTVDDGEGSFIDLIVCKTPALNATYDPTVKFNA